MSRYPRRTLLASGAAAAALAGVPAAALPVLSNITPQVSAGGAQPVIQSTTGAVRVDLNAPRTIIDWQSFNLTSGEQAQFRFDQRNWIVLNRVQSGAITIDGQVTGYQAANLNSALPAQTSGNVWFYSPQGVAFGPNARVDVGGMLATSAAVNEAQFLSASNLQIGFTGSGAGGPVTVAGGAQLQGVGYLAFVAPQVSTGPGSSVTAGDAGTAAYAAVDSYEITFLPSGQDLTFFTFVVPSGVAGGTAAASTPLTVAGATTAANVYLTTISRQAVTGALINAPGLLTGRSSQNNYGQVTITTGRNIINGQVNELSTPVVGARTGSVQLGEINASGNVNLYLSGDAGSGDLQATRVRAGQGLLILANNVTADALSGGDTGANLGSVRIVAAGTVDVGQVTARTMFDSFAGVARGPGNAQTLPTLRFGTVTAGTQVQFVADTLTATSITAANIASSTAGATSVGTLTGSGDVLVAASTNLTLGSVTAGALTRLTFEDLDLTGPVTAADAVLRILTPGEAIVGGSGTGRRVSNAEFQRFAVTGSLSIYGGIEGQFPVTNDLIVDDLDIDPGRIPDLRLYAKATQDVVIRGAMTPTDDGLALTIGEAQSVADTVWRPDRIIVTGALGSAEGDAVAGFTDVKAFGAIKLTATRDILIGSERFVDLVADVPAAEIDVSMGLPAGVAPVEEEVGLLFLVGASLDAYASERIVQQNTAPPGQQGGLFLTGTDVAATAPLLILGGAQVGEVFGALQVADGVVTTGSAASGSARIARADGDTSLGRIRINGCQLAIGCAAFTPANQFRVQQFRPAAPRAAIDPPVLTPPPPVDEDERQAETVITGAGNEEIWRKTK